MRIVIVGCGYVGTALAERLVSAGHEVWGVTRRSRALPPGVRGVTANVSTRDGCANLPECDAFVYAVSPGERSDAAYEAAYPRGVEHVLDALPGARAVLVSSTAVYAQENDEWVDEASETCPPTFNGVRLLEAEHVLAASGRPFAILRASGIYGPGRTSLLERARAGYVPDSSQDAYTNRIHRDDLAAALEFVLMRPELAGTFVASDTEPARLSDVIAWMRKRLGVTPAKQAGAAPSESRARRSKRCASRRLVDAGFRFAYPTFREGYSDLLAPSPS